ncbi:hypothetical protein PINS_up009914 [Pythium insidiosum]|nr:hypothetical protein PINS_up009914 [Pythium insidiosum]
MASKSSSEQVPTADDCERCGKTCSACGYENCDCTSCSKSKCHDCGKSAKQCSCPTTTRSTRSKTTMTDNCGGCGKSSANCGCESCHCPSCAAKQGRSIGKLVGT